MLFGFKPLDSTLPTALLKERKRQRGDDNEEAAAEEPKPKMTVFDRLERAAQLAPQGEKFLVRPSATAGAPPPQPIPQPQGALPWGHPGGAPPPNGTAAAAPLDFT